MSALSILERFKDAYVQFIDELLEQFPNEQDLVVVRVFFKDQIPTTVVADAFIEHVLPHKETIKNRNDKFFMENNHIFGMLDSGKVMHFKNLWTSPTLEDEDREAIWKWFDMFCILAEAYKKTK